jgi:5-methylcytosine-specific restriction enzyme subunit McrC
METVILLEHETVDVVTRRQPQTKALSQEQANALAKLAPRLPPGTFSWGHRSVKFAHYCGVIALGDLTIEILPKIYGKETEYGASRTALIRMLHKARRLPSRRGNIAGIALQKHVLLDVFILHFCDQLHAELMQGMIRHYIERQENLPVLRGKLRIEQQLKQNLAHRERLFCQYEELSTDNAYNQILKSVLRLLLRLVSGGETRKRLTELLMRFDAISDVTADLDMLDRLIFDRSNSRYEAIFEQCRWFIEGFHPDVLAGQASCLTLLFDMNRLFEAFVASELRKLAWKQGLRMREQGPQKYLARRKDTDERLFLMKPDMAFLDSDNRVVMVADAKWKLLDEREKKLGISQSDLYQMMSYAVRYRVGQLAMI